MNLKYNNATAQANWPKFDLLIERFKYLLYKQADILSKKDCVDCISERHFQEAWKILCNKK